MKVATTTTAAAAAAAAGRQEGVHLIVPLGYRRRSGSPGYNTLAFFCMSYLLHSISPVTSLLSPRGRAQHTSATVRCHLSTPFPQSHVLKYPSIRRTRERGRRGVMKVRREWGRPIARLRGQAGTPGASILLRKYTLKIPPLQCVCDKPFPSPFWTRASSPSPRSGHGGREGEGQRDGERSREATRIAGSMMLL